MNEKVVILPRDVLDARNEALRLIKANDPKDYDRLQELRNLLVDNCVAYAHTDCVQAIDDYFESQQAEA